MIGFDVLTLVKRRYEADALSQRIPQEDKREVFCRVQSVSQREFFEAGRNGFKPELKATLSTEFDYDGESIAIWNDDRYSIYRTFITDSGQIELYLQRETGTV